MIKQKRSAIKLILAGSSTLGFLILLTLLFNFVFISSPTFVKPQAKEPCDLAAYWPSGQVSRIHCTERLNRSEVVYYLKSQGVKVIAPVRQYQISLEPNDPNYKYQQNYLERIKAPEAWDKFQNGTLRPVIAVLDSGVDIDNPDLKNNIWFNSWEVPGDKIDNDNNGYVDDQYGWDFVANVPDPRPKFEDGWNEVAMNHGTIVAGVAAAQGGNAQGVAGIYWNARIMPIRVLNSKGMGDTITVAKGIDYAIRNHADIINLSFIGSLSDPVLEDAITRAHNAGILIVAAAGNEQQVGVDMNKQPQYPVCDDGLNGENMIIGVAAVDDKDVRAEFSNYGSNCIDLSAPGVRIFSTQFVDSSHKEFTEPYGGYWSGTSVAAPMVSGALAYLKAAYPRLSPTQLRDILIASGDQIDNVNPTIPGQLGRRLNLKTALDLAGSVKFPSKNPLVVAPQTSSLSNVSTFDVSGELLQTFMAYQAKFRNGVNLTAGDIEGDGQIEIITAPRAGGGPHVKIFNQQGEIQYQFMAFAENFRGGVNLALANFGADRKDQIIVATGRGGSNLIRVFDSQGNLWYQFVPYDTSYTGGVSVAAGDVDGDGQPEIITAPQDKTRLPIRVFTKFGVKKSEFYPFPSTFRGGINLAVGDVDGDGKEDIVAAPGAGGGPQVKVFNWRGKTLWQFFAYDKSFRGGVFVAVGDVDGDGKNEIATTPGAGGGSHVRIFNNRGEVRSQFFVEPTNFRGGLTLAIFR